MPRLNIIVCLCVCASLSVTVNADQVDDLITKLKDPDPFVRCYAAEQLAQLQDKRAIDPLLDLMTHPAPQDSSTKTSDPTVSDAELTGPVVKIQQAKRAVAGGDKHTPPTMTIQAAELKQYVTTLRTGTLIDQKNAAKALGQSRDKRAAAILIKMLKEGRFNNGLKSSMIEALGQIGDPAAYNLIIECLNDNSVFAKKSAITALGSLGDPRAARLIYQKMVDDFSLQHDGIEALKELGGYDAVFYLNKAAASNDFSLSSKAKDALNSFGLKHGLKPLLDLLKDADPEVKILATQQLALLNDPVIAADLQQAAEAMTPQDQQDIESTNKDFTAVLENLSVTDEVKVKVAAIEALGQFRDVKTIKPLMGQLTDRQNHPSVRRAAGKVLAKYQNRALLRTFEGELDQWDKNRQTAALESLGYLGTDEAVELIQPALNKPPLEKEAYEALALTENPKALPALYEAVENPRVRQSALQAIIRINDPASPQKLAEMLSLPGMRHDEKLQILKYLSTFNDPTLIDYLTQYVQDPFIGSDVLDILLQQDNPRIITPLVTLLVNGRSEKTRQKALDKLTRMNQPQTLDLIVQAVLDHIASQDTIPSPGQQRIPPGRLASNKELPDALARFAKPETVESLSRLLPIPEVQDGVANLLKKFNWKPLTTEQKIYYYVALEDWDACKQIGRPVIPFLLRKLKVSSSGQLASVLAQMNNIDAKPILLDKLQKWTIGSEQLQVLQTEFHWRPASIDEHFNIAAATKNYQDLLKLWDRNPAEIKQLLSERLNDTDDAPIPWVMNLCIHLGKEDMILLMISRFEIMKDGFETIMVANLFLGSGHERLEKAARDWADRKGYKVERRLADPSGRWGNH